MFNKVFGDKPWYKSMTAWGAILLGAATGAEQIGAVSPGTTSALATLAQDVGALLVLFGLRKAATAPNSK
jgi:hypothetical protein